MAIIKNKKSRVSEKGRSSGSEDDDENGFLNSGAGSDDFDDDLEAFDGIGGEYCQVGNQNCRVPYEIYDLSDLGSVLSIETWNNCLTEEERFGLCEFLPDMDQETFKLTLKELFSGKNFHFGSPIVKLFEQLKGGLCEPVVAVYWKCLDFFEKKRHYHLLKKYQNSMVGKLLKMQVDWGGYLFHRKQPASQMARRLEPERFGKRSPKGILKVKAPWKVNAGPNRLVSSLQSRLQVPLSSLHQKDGLVGSKVAEWGWMGNQMKLVGDESEEEHGYTMACQRDHRLTHEEGFIMDYTGEFDDWGFGRNKKWNIGEDLQAFKSIGGLGLRISSRRNAGISITQSDDTESDSSRCIGEEAEIGQRQDLPVVKDFRVYSRKRKQKEKNDSETFNWGGQQFGYHG